MLITQRFLWSVFSPLTVSGRLPAENFAMAFGDVIRLWSNTFAQRTPTHAAAAEFWMIEPEMAFCDLARTWMLQKRCSRYVIAYVLEHCPDELEMLNKFVDKGLLERLNHVATSPVLSCFFTPRQLNFAGRQ